jgi:uncharacterized membrane protein
MIGTLLTDALGEGWKVLSLFLLHYVLGKRGSFPYGLLVHFSLLKTAILVIVADIIQTIILLYLFDLLTDKFRWIQALKARLDRHREKREGKNWYRRIGGWGTLGLFLLSSLPQGGGALSGCLLAFGLQSRKLPAIIAISLGCIVSAGLFYLVCAGLLQLTCLRGIPLR